MRLAPIVIGALLAWGGSLSAVEQDGGPERALQAGAYAEAEALAHARLAELESSKAPDSLELARALDLVVNAAVRNGKAADSATLLLAQRAVEIKQRRLGLDSAELAASLHNLASIHERRGEFRTALPLHERGLSIRRATAPSDDREIANSLDAVARTLLGLERRPLAERTIERSLKIRVAQSAESPLALARTLELSGRAMRDDGRYQDAAADLDRALELWSRFAPGNPDRASALDARGYVYFLEGDISGARRVWEEAAALIDQRLDAWHPDRARSARSLALAEFALGGLASARALRERALAIGERAMAPCDPEVAFQLNDLAISLQYDGDYAAADRMFRRELETIRSCLGPHHSNVATAVYNQFVLAREMGSYQEAQRLGELAVRLWSNSLGPSHPFVAFGLNDLADFFASRGDQARAQSLFERALLIRRRAIGTGHPEVAWTLTGLARTKADLGDAAAARRLLQQAIAIFERIPPRDPDYLPTALALRGTLEARRGAFSSARASMGDALASRETNLGSKHPLVASTRAAVATLDLALGSYEPAFVGALMAEASARDLLRFTVRYMPDRRAMEYASARPRGLDVALSVVAGHVKTAAPQALDAVIQSRGIVLDELAARARSISAAPPQIASTAMLVGEARRRYAALVLRNLGQPSEPAVLERARREKEEAEEALAEQSTALRTELSRANAGLLDVRRAMPTKSALVSFVRYDQTDYFTRANRVQRRIIQSYVAFVSSSDRTEVELVPLGPAASLEELIAQWREEAGGRRIVEGVGAAQAERSYRAIGTRLRQRIWDPIAPYVAGAERTFIVPDGALNLVSFAALPMSRQRYLVEDGPPIHYLSAERDLIVQSQPPSDHGLLLVGGPSYDASVSPERSSDERRSGCMSGGSLRFDDLPGSRAEIRDIAAIWSSRSKLEGSLLNDVVMLSGRAASKSAVIDAAHGRKILHLATHGFFLGECDALTAGTRSVGGLVGRLYSPPADPNPLLLAGLAFAGANALARRSSHDSGILTAEEVSALNLQGTEWAVLSACDTGLGQTTSGEGVLGLRRAFQVAGVKTIVMSLWSVQDRATRDWMVALYRARLLERLDTVHAVRQASLTLLRDRKAKGWSTHPFYWAAFVAAGDWR